MKAVVAFLMVASLAQAFLVAPSMARQVGEAGQAVLLAQATPKGGEPGQAASKGGEPGQAAPKGGAAAPEDLSRLAWWVGKYPSDRTSPGRPAGSGRTFFEDPAILPALKAMLPRRELGYLIKGWNGGLLDMPIEREGDMLMVGVCKPHDCAGENAVVYVNLVTGSVQACWTQFDEAKRATEAFWYAPGQPPRRLEKGEGCFGQEKLSLFRKYGVK